MYIYGESEIPTCINRTWFPADISEIHDDMQIHQLLYNYSELANAMIVQSIDDYNWAKKYLEKHPDYYACSIHQRSTINRANKMIGDSIAFWKSDWCLTISPFASKRRLWYVIQEATGYQFNFDELTNDI